MNEIRKETNERKKYDHIFCTNFSRLSDSLSSQSRLQTDSLSHHLVSDFKAWTSSSSSSSTGDTFSSRKKNNKKTHTSDLGDWFLRWKNKYGFWLPRQDQDKNFLIILIVLRKSLCIVIILWGFSWFTLFTSLSNDEHHHQRGLEIESRDRRIEKRCIIQSWKDTEQLESLWETLRGQPNNFRSHFWSNCIETWFLISKSSFVGSTCNPSLPVCQTLPSLKSTSKPFTSERPSSSCVQRTPFDDQRHQVV